jgi:hypothetical protein
MTRRHLRLMAVVNTGRAPVAMTLLAAGLLAAQLP